MSFCGFYLGCVQISNDREVQITRVGSKTTFKWKLKGAPDNSTLNFHVFIYNPRKVEIFTDFYKRNTINTRLYYKKNSQIEKNRTTGYLNLNAGNGILTVNLYNVQFNDSRVFSFEFFSSSSGSEEMVNNITLDVQSKSLFNFFIFSKRY